MSFDIREKCATLDKHLKNYGLLNGPERPLVVAAILLTLKYNSRLLHSLNGKLYPTDGNIIFSHLTDFIGSCKISNTIKIDILNQYKIVENKQRLNSFIEAIGSTPLRYFAEYLQKHIIPYTKKRYHIDILGLFLGDRGQRELGIVLTPSSLNQLCCELLDIKSTDSILEPTCGTGSFFVAAWAHILKDRSKKDVPEILKNNMYGVEIQDDLFALAVANLLLLGSDSIQLTKSDFLALDTNKLRQKRCNVGFLNPPYSQNKGRNFKALSELNFLLEFLNSLAKNGRGAAILPLGAITNSLKKYNPLMKQRILERHTLEGVITFQEKHFKNIGVFNSIAIFTAHQPHPPKKASRFIDICNLSKERDQLLRCWRGEPSPDKNFMIEKIITADDEWLHAAFFVNQEIPKESQFTSTVIDFLAFEFEMVLKDKEFLFSDDL